MQLKFLGTGTSQGVPIIGCTHPVCLSKNPKDKRLRSSAILTTDTEKKILIDCGPDFRQQMLAQNESQVDAVLLTHEHNDHIIGLDDLRPLIFNNRKPMPIYCQSRVAQEVKVKFPYAFAEIKYPGAPSFEVVEISHHQPFQVLETTIQPIEIFHGKLPILGYRIGGLAYITDASLISKDALNQLKNLEILVINALRLKHEHPSHFILPQALEIIQQLAPKKAFITHISHKLGFHEEVERQLPPHIRLAYDGLVVNW